MDHDEDATTARNKMQAPTKDMEVTVKITTRKGEQQQQDTTYPLLLEKSSWWLAPDIDDSFSFSFSLFALFRILEECLTGVDGIDFLVMSRFNQTAFDGMNDCIDISHRRDHHGEKRRFGRTWGVLVTVVGFGVTERVCFRRCISCFPVKFCCRIWTVV